MYVKRIYWGCNYANHANKQRGAALDLIQTISQYHYTSMSSRHKHATHFYCSFTFFLVLGTVHPICVTEHLFQPQKRSRSRHSKSDSVLFKGTIWLVYCECFCPDTHLHGQNTHCAHHKVIFSSTKLVKLGFLHPTKCIVLYVPALADQNRGIVKTSWLVFSLKENYGFVLFPVSAVITEFQVFPEGWSSFSWFHFSPQTDFIDPPD